jgi:hypothetical protein
LNCCFLRSCVIFKRLALSSILICSQCQTATYH